jgi:MFS family permease
LRSLATLYGFTWTAYAISAAAGSILLGRAFDQTGSYQSLLVELSALMLLAGVLMAGLPRYGTTSTDRHPEPDRVGQADAANVPAAP